MTPVQVGLREEMEVALKESVRELQRALERKDTVHNQMNVEYLKNTLLTLYRTGEVS